MSLPTIKNRQKCFLMLFSDDSQLIAFTAIRFIVLSLYLVWIVISIFVKELRNKHMILLFNLIAVGIFYDSYGITFSFYSSCFKATEQICLVQAIVNLFVAYNNGYAFSALALHRMLIAYVPNINNYLKKRYLFLIILTLWILPVLFTVLHVFVKKYTVFTGLTTPLGLCLNIIVNPNLHLIFFIIFGIFIPNALIIGGFILSYRILKLRTSRVSTQRSAQSLRITIQIAIHVILFELDLFSNLFLFILAPKGIIQHSMKLFQLFFLVKGLSHFNSLGMLYFHPVMILKYKQFFSKRQRDSSLTSNALKKGSKKYDNSSVSVKLLS